MWSSVHTPTRTDRRARQTQRRTPRPTARERSTHGNQTQGNQTQGAQTQEAQTQEAQTQGAQTKGALGSATKHRRRHIQVSRVKVTRTNGWIALPRRPGKPTPMRPSRSPIADGPARWESRDRTDAYWTWRLFRDGYTASQIAQIRRCDLSSLDVDLSVASESGHEVRADWWSESSVSHPTAKSVQSSQT